MVIISSFSVPESPIHLEINNIRVTLDKRDFGAGNLYISERTVCWQGEHETGFSIPYTHISMHAVCKDPTVCASDCIYVMVDTHFEMPGSVSVIEDGMDNESNGSEPDVSEMLLIPTNAEDVTRIYEALMHCQALNPDPEDMSDEDDEDHVYQDAENEITEDMGGGGDIDVENISHRLAHNTIQVNYSYNNGDNQQLDDDQYEDAD